MANYMGTARTNYFRVTDEEKYKKLSAHLLSEDTIHDFTFTKDNVVWHGFGAYSSIEFELPDENANSEETDDPEIVDIFEFGKRLQEILPEGEAFIYQECGYEKLRYVTAFCVIATKDDLKCLDMTNSAIKMARDMLKDDKWTTKMEY